MTRALRLVGLTLLWVALWGELSVANLAGGALVGAAVVALFDTSRDERPTVRPAAAARFGVLFAAGLRVYADELRQALARRCRSPWR